MSLAGCSAVMFSVLLGGCASTPAHYYTLVPESSRPPAAGTVPFPVAVDSVRIPGQVDRLELVTRRPDGGVTIADGERWIAPVADEIQNALSVELSARLAAAVPSSVRWPDSVSVRLNVERFESSLSRYALVDASWRLDVKAVGKDVRLVCRTQAYEPVSGGYPELVYGYQRAMGVIADDIAAVAREVVGGMTAGCPHS